MGIGPPAIQGTWASADQVSVTSFASGAFTTRERATGVLLASDGRYVQSGNQFSMRWTSLLANETRTATCEFQSASEISCTTGPGATFTLVKVA